MFHISTFVTPQKLKRSLLSRYDVMGPQVICLELVPPLPRHVRATVNTRR